MEWAYVAGYFDGEGNVSNYLTARGDKTRGITWYNSHLESLEAIRAFLGCGRIQRPRTAKGGPVYALAIRGKADLVRVLDGMLPHLIVKRAKALELLAYLDGVNERSPNFGKMAAISTEQLLSWYHEERLAQAQIAQRVGVSSAAVAQAFKHRGLTGRSGRFVKGFAQSEETRRRRAETYRRLWADPAFREQRMKATRKDGDSG